MLMQVILNLAFVLSLAFAFYVGAKKFRQGTGLSGGATIKTTAVLSLGNKEKILLLEVLGEKILVGVTANQMTALKCFSEKAGTGTDEVNTSSFSQIFQKKSVAVGEME